MTVRGRGSQALLVRLFKNPPISFQSPDQHHVSCFFITFSRSPHITNSYAQCLPLPDLHISWLDVFQGNLSKHFLCQMYPLVFTEYGISCLTEALFSRKATCWLLFKLPGTQLISLDTVQWYHGQTHWGSL